ncbi:MAG: hypothetical protein KGL39_27630 [Patescibacteria group bacterium]|nr:hypothetical protein [Patescibacteria group bacterium]
MDNIDMKTLLDFGVLAVSALAAWESMKTKLAIAQLKLWIMENFEPKTNRRKGDES